MSEELTLAIEVRGEVIASNAGEFREMVKARLASIETELTTDAQFGEAESTVKGLKGAEQAVKEAKAKALQDAEQLHSLFSILDDTSEEIREARLGLERQIKAKKAEVRERMIAEALETIEHPRAEIMFMAKAMDAIKGKKALGSISKALALLVNGINAELSKSRSVLDQFEAEHGRDMTRDREALELKSTDPLEAELRRRLELKEAEEAINKAKAEAREAREKAAKEAAAAALELKQAKAVREAKAIEEKTPPAPPEAPLPSPPKIGSIPTGKARGEGVEAAREWEEFKQECLRAFAPVRAARLELRNPANKAKAREFAEALAEAWKGVLS